MLHRPIFFAALLVLLASASLVAARTPVAQLLRHSHHRQHADGSDNAVSASSIRVELRVFSGDRNPEWTLSLHSNSAVVQRIHKLALAQPKALIGRTAPAHRLGYTGFVLRSAATTVVVYDARGTPELEQLLLKSGISAGAVPTTVASYMRTELKRVHTEALPVETDEPTDVANVKATFAPECKLPVVGADNETKFDPTGADDCGWFMADEHTTLNNCYDYGNDIVTDTFAQPGRGSGQKWKENTCEDIRAAAERDGLVWANTTLPTEEPKKGGHYVALLIWPDTNFHWIRFDSMPAGHWSHKPGSTPVTEFDNNGDLIHDPSKQDFSPWSQFCGYMISVPSKVKIN